MSWNVVWHVSLFKQNDNCELVSIYNITNHSIEQSPSRREAGIIPEHSNALYVNYRPHLISQWLLRPSQRQRVSRLHFYVILQAPVQLGSGADEKNGLSA